MQKAVFVKEVGKPLVLGERAIPEPSNGNLLIKVQSTMRKLASHKEVWISRS
jgi:hypothetical protein